MNPWLSIWLHPRQTIRTIVDTNPAYLVLPLALASGATELVIQVAGGLAAVEADWPWLPALSIAAAAGAFFGVVGLYIFGWVYRWVGSWFGGQASHREVRAAIAWVKVPTFAVFGVWVLVQALQPGQGIAAVLSSAVLVIVGVVAGIWSFVLACHAIGEVHRFSSWRGLGTILIPHALLVVPVFMLAMLAAIAIPNLLRARVVANESAAIGNMRALASSVERYRTVKDGYPPSAEWNALYPPGDEPSFGPPPFRAGGALSDHAVQGYHYTYRSEDGAHYAVTALPDGVPGRSFYVDETGIVRHCQPAAEGEAAERSDPPVEEAPAPC